LDDIKGDAEAFVPAPSIAFVTVLTQLFRQPMTIRRA
jgi:hypothetical protein